MLNQRRSSDIRLILIAMIGAIFFLVFIVAFVGLGAVRQMPIFWKEDIRTTIAFKEINGQLRVVGIMGNGQMDPTLVMKSGDTPYILTVINADTQDHMFYVDGLNAHTTLLHPGQNDTITLVSKKEYVYNYYDRLNPEKVLGQIIAAKVEPTD